MIRASFLVISICFAQATFAYQQQTAKIKELYVHENGSLAILLEGGFSPGVMGECGNNNGYAGIRDSDPLIKTFLMAQYVADNKVKIGFSGCQGAWIKIVDVRGVK